MHLVPLGVAQTIRPLARQTLIWCCNSCCAIRTTIPINDVVYMDPAPKSLAEYWYLTRQRTYKTYGHASATALAMRRAAVVSSPVDTRSQQQSNANPTPAFYEAPCAVSLLYAARQ